jgi:methylmalonyl-CoA mutase cobalamin-binding subunit
LQQGIAEIGEGWYHGDVTVQQEHFCSSLVIRRLESLILATPPPVRPGRFLIACPPEEEHVIGPLVLTALLRRRGWEVVYLGADVPMERLGVTVRSINPTLAILAAQQLYTAATLLEAARLLQAERVPVAYGGRIFNLIPELHSRIPGYFLGEGLAQAAQEVEALMIAPRPASAMPAVPEAYQRARAHFREHREVVEAQVVQMLVPKGFTPSLVTMVNRELGLGIDAALALGDMSYLGTEIEWVRGLIRQQHIPDEALHTYLEVYHQAAEDHLDGRAEPIVTWLRATAGSL